ncbi:FeoB-associated Cys-rich membrane protein [Nonlabens sp. Hel1_33_55]|nr:FeoB-associated Cys-rich membrane protein [Nonlabens sp. Hel1_33_55]
MDFTILIQYIIVAVIVITAIGWLFRKRLFPSRYNSKNCGDGDCGCH